MSLVKADSEGWTVFLGRRIVLEVSSSDCNRNRTSLLVRAGRQRMRVVKDGSKEAADKSTPDCLHLTVLHYSDRVIMRL